MGSTGATHIADAIASNSTRLMKLDLTENKLTDTDALAIGQALRNNTTLERLGMQATRQRAHSSWRNRDSRLCHQPRIYFSGHTQLGAHGIH